MIARQRMHFFATIFVAQFGTGVEFLARLERGRVPTIHNMIMSDRLDSKLPYHDVVAFASFLAKRLVSVLQGD